MFPSPFADHILHDRTAVNINVKLSTVVNTVLRKTLKVHVHCNYVNIFHQPFPQCKISIYQCWQCHIRIYLQVSRKLQFSYFGYDIKRYDMNNFILCMKSNKNAEVQNFKVWNISKLLVYSPAIPMIYLNYFFSSPLLQWINIKMESIYGVGL